MTTKTLADLRKAAKLPAAQAGGSVVADFFETNKQSMMAVLPKHVSADRMTRIALTALRNTPKLMQCTTESLMGAVMQCAQLGLEPNTVLGHSYLIPFNNRKQNRTDVQVIIGYKGLLALARNSGQIISLAAHEVYENDEFEYAYGLDEMLTHKPAMDNRGDIVAFYAVAKLVGGGHVFEVMSKQAVDTVMHNTQSKGKYGPWADHYPEMGRKTVIRRIFKYLPVSIELATATAMDEVAEGGGNQHLETALAGEYSVVNDDYARVDQEPIDAHGEVWNQDVHATGEDGHPVYNQDGSFRARRGTKISHDEGQTPESPADPEFSFAQIAELLNAAQSQDAIDEIMSLIGGLPDDQRSEIQTLADRVAKTMKDAA